MSSTKVFPSQTAEAKRRYAETRYREQTPCGSCGARYRLPSGRCGSCSPAKQRAYHLSRKENNVPCSACGAADRTDSGRCRPCVNASARRRSDTKDRTCHCGTPIKDRRHECVRCAFENKLRTLYRTDVETVARMYEAQGRRCEVCRDCLPFKGRETHIDHCHATGKVRGILCGECNVGLGRFRDDPVTLSRAAEYVLGARRG